MRAFVLSLFCLAGPAWADLPKVVTDIAPVHGLVSQVMKGVGTPELILPAKVSPHHHAMRPSQARMLADADLVVWIGESMTPWLEGPLETLPEGAQILRLSASEGVKLLPLREAGILHHLDEDHGHDHDHAKGHDKDHGHEDAHAQGHEEEHDHGHEKDHDHGHKEHDHREVKAEGPFDPHLWLHPENGALWLDHIADALAKMDPENADRYRANAAAGRSMIEAQRKEIEAQLAPLQDRSFVVLHDAFQYFEAAFGLEAFAAVKSAEADAPGAARLTLLREGLLAGDVLCALSEPQINTDLLEPLLEDTQIRVGQLDPLGADIPPGPEQYGQLLQAMADSFQACLAEGS